MESKLFTKNVENKKIKLIESFYDKGNFTAALNEIEHYLMLYPYDLKVLFFKGKILRMLKMVDEAKKEFLKLFSYVESGHEYGNKILVELIYLEMSSKNYLTAYSYLKRLQKSIGFKTINSLNMDLAEVYLKHQCGISIEDSKKNNYFGKQVMDYSEERFINRLLNNNVSSLQESERFRRFSSDVDLIDLYKRIKDVLPLASVTPAYNVFDTYIFEYPGAGFDDEGELNYIQVLAYNDVGGGVLILEISPFRVKRYKSYINDIVDLECQKYYSDDDMCLKREI